MNYRDGKILKISNSLDRYSSPKIGIQLHEKIETNFGKTDIVNTSRRSKNFEKYARLCVNRTREGHMRHAKARDHTS